MSYSILHNSRVFQAIPTQRRLANPPAIDALLTHFCTTPFPPIYSTHVNAAAALQRAAFRADACEGNVDFFCTL